MLRKTVVDEESRTKEGRRRASKQQDANLAVKRVGQQLRIMRKARRLSIRTLAEISGLSANTLSLIENGKTSPSVGTLHQLAKSLDIPIIAFFENEHPKRRIVYQKTGERQQLNFSQGHVEMLNAGMPHLGSEPFIAHLEPSATSDDTPIVFPGREFIYCLEGHITYMIGGEAYPLAPGDSLIFDSYTPHTWRNTSRTKSSALVVLCPEDPLKDSTENYLMP